MKKRYVIGSTIAILIMAFFAMSAQASANSEVWLSKDSTGYPKATEIQEGDTVWVVVKDTSRGDTDQLDRIYTQILLYDVKTGAYLNWDNTGTTLIDRNFLLETAPDSGLFVSNEAFQIGGRVGGTTGSNVWTHTPGDLAGGEWLYYEGTPGTLSSITRAEINNVAGRVENMDTLILMYIDPDDPQDISTSLTKIEDTTSTVTWPLGNPTNATKPVTVRITDPDENVTCEIEAVPVFFAINPGASVQTNTFCMFNREQVLRWYNIYMAGGSVAGTHELLSTSLKNLSELVGYGTSSVTLWGALAVETGVGTGVFEFTLEDLATGFPLGAYAAPYTGDYVSFSTNDVVVAYYLDPNDFDDFQLASSYVGSPDINDVWYKGTRGSGDGYYNLGRDYLQIGVEDLDAGTPCCPDEVTVYICDPHGEDDSESLALTEVGVNSSQFDGTMELRPVWDALGTTTSSGYQLAIDNNRFEAFNEDSIYVRYNGSSAHKVSFDLVKVSDTQVFDGTTLNLSFVDASGKPVSFYQSDEIAYIKVVDPDQNENSVLAETIKSYWDKGLNRPFGPGYTTNPYVTATGNWNITAPTAQQVFGSGGNPAKIYLWNPKSGEWYAVELLETGVNTGVFMSKAGVPLYETCVSTCTVFAEDKDTVLAFYQDPSNHSDIAIVQIKVDNNASRTTFVDKDGATVSSYADTDSAYVLVKDRGHASELTLANAITIDKTGTKYSLTRLSVTDNTFITGAIPLTALGGETITATYVDPDDTDDTSSDSISVVRTVYPAATATFVNSAGTTVTTYTEGDSAYVKVVDQRHAGATTLTNALTINQGVGTFSLTLDVIPGGNNYTFTSGAISLGVLADVTITATYTDPTDSTRTATDSIPVNSAAFTVEKVTVLPNPFVTEATFAIEEGTGFPDKFLVTVYDLARHEVWKSEQSSVTEITWDGGDLANGPYIYVIVITSSDLDTPYTKKGMVFINR